MAMFKVKSMHRTFYDQEIGKGSLWFDAGVEFIPCRAYRNLYTSYDNMCFSEVIRHAKNGKIYWENKEYE